MLKFFITLLIIYVDVAFISESVFAILGIRVRMSYLMALELAPELGKNSECYLMFRDDFARFQLFYRRWINFLPHVLLFRFLHERGYQIGAWYWRNAGRWRAYRLPSRDVFFEGAHK